MSLTGTQLTLDAPAPRDELTPAPVHNGTLTSIAAAERIEPVAGTLRRRLLDYLRERAERGATDEEMQVACEMNANTQRPRRVELETAGWIVRTEHVRKTMSGRDAVVYRVADEATA